VHAERLGWDIPVLVGNEADLGVIAELRRGAARGLDDVIYVHGEVGVGAGIITGGRPLIGAAGYAGELGHFPVSADGRPCRCGSHGCWETEVGGEALLVRAGYPSDARQEGIDAVLRDAAAGSPVALAAIELTGERLGVGLAGFVNAFNPRLIVLGGLFGRLQPFAQAAIWTAMAARTLPAPLAMVRVVPASLGNDAPLLGAAEMALEVVLRDPATRLGSRDGVAELVTA
jgi:predicted NBD/HSP70 family sugar kinase